VADVVQLIRVVPVVIQHVVQQRERFLGAHGLLIAVRVGVDMSRRSIVRMFVIVHENHPFCCFLDGSTISHLHRLHKLPRGILNALFFQFSPLASYRGMEDQERPRRASNH
jgi:hypothetical protein